MRCIGSPFVYSLPGIVSKGLGLAGPVAAAIVAVVATTPASAQSVPPAVAAANSAVQSAIQSELQSIRDRIQTPGTPGPGGYPAPAGLGGPDAGDPFDGYMGLGYARKSAAPPPSDITVSLWGLGSGTHEDRSGFSNGVNIGSNSTSWTGIGGADAVKLGIFNRYDAFVIGVLGSDTFTNSSTAVGAKTKATTPGVGTYMAYINGAFSTDFAFTTNFTDASTNAAGTVTDLKATSYNYTGNLNYRIDLVRKWWLEPTAGLSYTLTTFNMAGLNDAEVTVGQIGARLGTEFRGPDGIKVQPTFGFYAYTDLELTGGAPAGIPGAAQATDAGKVFWKETGKLNFQFTDKLSAAIEGDVYETEGVLGYAGMLSGRVSF